MSGHNPHGRLGQPTPSWNHLQVPSFIPRQPQLAHMNESIRSSPLNWHTQSEAALYNYAMAATQHKTPLELNPLLPPFVRPPVVNSFGSVDLSIPSHAKHNSTPSPHNTTAISNSVTPPLEFGSTLQFPSSKTTLNNSNNIPSTNSLKDVTSNIVNGDKMLINSNLNDKLSHCDSMTNANLANGLFVAHQMTNESSKNNAWMAPTSHTEPMELIKETVKIFKNVLINELMERSATMEPTTISQHSPSSSLTDLTNSTTNNNISAQRLNENPSPNHCNTSNSHNTSKDSLISTSNDESLDSNGGKKRRRRKPNKTCRLSNNSNNDFDNCQTTNEHLNDNNIDSNKIIDTTPTIDESIEIKKDENINENDKNEQINHKTENEINCDSNKNGNESLGKPLENVDNLHISENGINNSTDDITSPTTRTRSSSRLSSPRICHDNNSNSPSLQNRPGKRKLDNDDCETIDKIAAMIASTTSTFNPNEHSTPQKLSSPIENGKLKEIVENQSIESNQIQQQKDSHFDDVEIKLEEMFAGIDDDNLPEKNEIVKNAKLDGCREVRVTIESIPSVDKVVAKVSNKKGIKSKAIKTKLDTSTSNNDDSDHKIKKNAKRLPKTKLKKGATKKTAKSNKSTNNSLDNKKTKIKEETSVDTTSKFKGPFVHVKTDGSSNVVNAPITEEVAENKLKLKKSFNSQNHNDRNKVRGLHVSTLSIKYDASTTDKTWMCVFCKMGPHKFGLGDLFGPYILSTTSEEFALSQTDPDDDVFRSKRTKADMIQKRTLPETIGQSPLGNQKRKRKINEPIPSTSSNSTVLNGSNDIDIFYGMTKATDDSYEIWTHGDCAVWSSGVLLIGTRIIGLDAAVWSSTRYRCSKCERYGAMISCFKRGCGDVAHIPCARTSNWNLNDDNFKVLCDKHCENLNET